MERLAAQERGPSPLIGVIDYLRRVKLFEDWSRKTGGDTVIGAVAQEPAE